MENWCRFSICDGCQRSPGKHSSTIYDVGEVDEEDSSSLQEALAADPAFSPLVAYCLMIFTLIYSPCLAALAVLRRETNSWK
ncbi:nucleoside recognition domain-containing protein [Sporomusa ovata]|uniref:nucleoside recognition domain-containing protein n=1 Tax=Sporomusa ovata TaxID=2378 RepID=UPI0008FBD4A1|nr:nucleoside recognition domain-containing protein [Sporomusa ovata]